MASKKQHTTIVGDEHALETLADAVRAVGAAAVTNTKLAGVSDILRATFKALGEGDPWLSETAESADKWLRRRGNERVDGLLWGHEGRTSDAGAGYANAARLLLAAVGDPSLFVDAVGAVDAIRDRVDLETLWGESAVGLVQKAWERSRTSDPEGKVKVALRALGASEQWTRNLYGALEQQSRRKSRNS